MKKNSSGSDPGNEQPRVDGTTAPTNLSNPKPKQIMILRTSLLTLAAATLAFAATRQADARPYGYAYNATGQLFSFDLTNPSAVVPIGSATAGANTRGIDVRPGSSLIYTADITATTTQIFVVNPGTGVRTPVGPAILNAGLADNGAAYAIDPAAPGYGFNFNPVTLQGDGSSRFRLVDANGNNYRFNSSTGTVSIVDGSIAYTDGTSGTISIGAAAYTNSDTERAGTAVAGTMLYYLDAASDVLAISDSPNAGTIQSVGPLGIDIDSVVGMEIYSPDGNVAAGGGSNFAYVVTSVDGGSSYQLATVDLTNGAVSPPLGSFPAGFTPVNGFAIVDFPEIAPPTSAVGFGYNVNGQLFSFPLGNPADVTPIGATGNYSNGLDFFPGTLSLYSFFVGQTTSQLSLVDVTTGLPTAIGEPIPNAGTTPGSFSLTSTLIYGFDFNPTTLQTDNSARIRLVDNTGQNLRLNNAPAAGATTVASVDGSINIDGTVVQGVTAASYTNSETTRMGAVPTPTRLYYVDTFANRLLTSPAANDGTSTPVGPLGADVGFNVGFEILSVSGFNIGYVTASIGETGIYTLHTVDLQTGALSPAIGTFPSGFTPVGGFAIGLNPPTSIGPDITPPTVSINRIRPVTIVSSDNTRFRVRGVAFDDNSGVAQVLSRTRGDDFSFLTSNTRFGRNVRLRPGNNPVRFIAVDAAGNVSQQTRVVIRRQRR